MSEASQRDRGEEERQGARDANVLGVLTGLRDLLREPESPDEEDRQGKQTFVQQTFLEEMRNMFSQMTQGKGSGTIAEAFARLQGMGILDDFTISLRAPGVQDALGVRNEESGFKRIFGNVSFRVGRQSRTANFAFRVSEQSLRNAIQQLSQTSAKFKGVDRVLYQ